MTANGEKALRSQMKSLCDMGQMTSDEAERFLKEMKKPIDTSPQKNILPKLLTRKDVAELFQMSVKTIDRMVDSGKLHPLHVTGSRSVRFPEAQIRAMSEPANLEESLSCIGSGVKS